MDWVVWMRRSVATVFLIAAVQVAVGPAHILAAVAPSKQNCRMIGAAHCPGKARLGVTPDCCVMAPSPAQAPVAVFSPVSPRALEPPIPGRLPVLSGSMPAVQRAIEVSARVPLKLPHDPTYLRISVLLI